MKLKLDNLVSAVEFWNFIFIITEHINIKKVIKNNNLKFVHNKLKINKHTRSVYKTTDLF